MISAKILLDSYNVDAKKRLTTFELKYPRFIHSELLTHRVFSRNSASSRAIPIAKMMEQVQYDPVYPIHWGKNRPGMQATEELSTVDADEARVLWTMARLGTTSRVEDLLRLGVHKQVVNRLLEPFQHMTTILTATEFENFYRLRCSPEAQPELRALAEAMRDAQAASRPTPVEYSEWHCPLLEDREEIWKHLCAASVDLSWEHLSYRLYAVSAARCARVSYLTHDGVRDIAKDLELAERLIASGHWSPFEHVAVALPGADRSGNFVGWRQFRADLDPNFWGV